MRFEVLGDIEDVERIAAGPNVKVRALLRKAYGQGRWRKMKGVATIRLPNGQIRASSYIGTKRMGSAAVTSRSSAT